MPEYRQVGRLGMPTKRPYPSRPIALTGQAKELALEAGEEWMSEADEARMLAEIRDGEA